MRLRLPSERVVAVVGLRRRPLSDHFRARRFRPASGADVQRRRRSGWDSRVFMAFNGAAPTLAARLFACGLRVRANFVARGLCGGWRAIGSPKFHHPGAVYSNYPGRNDPSSWAAFANELSHFVIARFPFLLEFRKLFIRRLLQSWDVEQEMPSVWKVLKKN